MKELGKVLGFPSGEEERIEDEADKPAAVEIGRFVSDEEGFKVLVRCEVRGDEVIIEEFEGGKEVVKTLKEEGLTSPFGEKLFPKDGEKFFDLLRLNFRTPYLYARERFSK